MNQALAVYGSWLAATVGKVKLIGNSREFDLEKIFVELTIFEEYRRPTDKDALWSLMDAELRKKRTLFPRDEDKHRPKSQDDQPELEPQKIRRIIQPDQLIKPGTRALIVGAPGCGKTTLMRWLAWMTHNHGQHLPVFLELKTVARALIDKRPLVEILIESITGRCFQTQPSEGFKQYFSEQLRIGNVTILLDGLDEISDQKNLLQEAIRDFLASLPRNLSLIVSTRPYALTSAFAGLEQMEIGPLTDQQMSNFLKHYYQDKPNVVTGLEKELKQQTELRDLARVPFLLGVIAWLYQEHGIASGEPLKLYDQLVKQLAGKPDEEKSIQRFQFPDSEDHDTKREFLAFLASERLLDRTRQDKDDWLVFSEDEIKETAARFCQTKNVKSTDSMSLAEDVIHTALLREVGLERYTFIHLTIHEYLGAKALARDKKALCRAFFNPTLAEMEVFPMALGMTSDPDSFYEALEQLPESLDFKNLRVRARGLRYAGSKLGELRINHHADRMIEFVKEEKQEKTPYKEVVLQSFFSASERIKNKFSLKLIDTLRNKSWLVRRKTALALGQLGVGSVEEVEALLRLLKDNEPSVQNAAATALGQLGVTDIKVVMAFVELLRDGHRSVFQSVEEALGRLVVRNKEVARVLLNLLSR
ncbi:MAG: NACHT domain-containing protein [Acidobacteria bacterium]|nr:NACHT domain-containing protein [Acidobacteriota bacterium]